jgi:hypothetical protein
MVACDATPLLSTLCSSAQGFRVNLGNMLEHLYLLKKENVEGEENTNYPNLIITHCTHMYKIISLYNTQILV